MLVHLLVILITTAKKSITNLHSLVNVHCKFNVISNIVDFFPLCRLLKSDPAQLFEKLEIQARYARVPTLFLFVLFCFCVCLFDLVTDR